MVKKTTDNLKMAITGETNACKRYELFSLIAKDENLLNISKLFSSLVKAEKIHIKNHKNALKDSFSPVIEEVERESTLKNLINALKGERDEYKKMYPSFIKISKKSSDNFMKVSTLSFKWARDSEKKHYQLLKMAYKSLVSGEDFDQTDFYICKVCGNVELKLKKMTCDICGHDNAFFIKE